MNDYKCSCAPGYNGRLCEFEIDECSLNPCNQQGVCTDQVNSYLCECFPEYTVSHCDLVMIDKYHATTILAFF